MSVIRIDPGEVTRISSDFRNMSKDVDALVSRAKGVMSNLESQFTGARATKIYGQWHDMEPSLQAAINTLLSAGDLLASAQRDFSDADMR